MSRPSQLDVGTAGRITLDSPMGTLAALQTGTADRHVLLVPGYTGSKEDFAPVLAPLAAAGYRVTALDLPGQFESAGPAEPWRYTTDALGATLRAVLTQLSDDPVHLVGHSFGGLVCRAAVLAEPARFRSLTLLDSGPAAIGGQRRAVIELLGPVLPELGVSGVYDAADSLDRAAPGDQAPAPDLAAFLRRRFLAGTAAMLEGMAAALLAEPDRVAELAATGVALAVMYGADDDAWPPQVQAEMARRLAVAPVVIEGAVHSPAIENPDAIVAALLAFWREPDADGGPRQHV